MDFKMFTGNIRFKSVILILMVLGMNLLTLVTSESDPHFNLPLNKPLLDSEPPQFGFNYTQKKGYTGDTFNFTVNVTDNTGIDKVYVNFTWPGAGQFFNNTMINNSGNWTYITTMPTIVTTITYHYWANDTSGNAKKSQIGIVTVLDNDEPQFESGSGDFTIGTGNNFIIYANFTDNDDVSNAIIYYRKESTGSYSYTGMSENPDDHFYVTNIFLGIDTTNDITGYYYYILAHDNTNNEFNYTYNETQGLPWSISILDDDPPTFETGTGNFSTDIGNGFTIYANFTDNLGADNVASAKIYYWQIGNITILNAPMQKTGAGMFQIDNFSMNINTIYDDTDYYYYLWVNDTNGNSATYPIFYNFTITVVDNIKPTFISGSGDIFGYCNSGFMIYANFSDNIDVDRAVIYYAYESNNTYRDVSMIESLINPGYFYITNATMNVDIYANLTNLTYYIIAYDKSDNQVRYNDTGGADWNITIIDNVKPIAINGSGSFFAYTRYPFTIYANFTDNIKVTRAVINFRLQTQTGFCKCNMTAGALPGSFFVTSENLSQAACIDHSKSVIPIFYYILGYDTFNNTGNYSAFEANWVVTILDNTPPQIINSTGDFTITTGEPFIIYANFTDNINISFAEIKFKRKTTAGSSTKYDTVTMDLLENKPGKYYVTSEMLGIDTYWDDRDVFYYFFVQDLDGNNESFRKPSQIDFKISIIDNDSPWFDSGNGNLTIGTGDRFELFANFTDNIDVDFVRFYLKKETWNYWTSQDFTVEDINNDKVWEFHILSSELDITVDTTNDDSDYFYYFRVFDGYKKAPNTYNYTYGQTGFRIEVLDDDPPTSAKPRKGSGDFYATTGESFSIYANFTDNIKISFAVLYLRLDKTGSSWSKAFNMTEFNAKPGYFYIINSDLNINTTKDDQDYFYYVDCQDLAGNPFTFNNNGEPFKITVLDNDKPIAEAGSNQEVVEGTLVFLNANLSYDNIGVTTYTWKFDYANIEQSLTGVQTDFKFDNPGSYIVLLIVTDKMGNEGKDDVYINVTEKNYPPQIISSKPEKDQKIFAFKPLISEISVQFNEKILIKDIKNIDFFYIRDPSGATIHGKFSWSEYTNKILFEPDADLEYDTQYTAIVTTNVTDEFNSHLEKEYSWTFNTHPEDSDGDKLPDKWEYDEFDGKYGINQIGPNDDPDRDGFTNLEEYLAGTDPNNPKDHPPKKEDGKETEFNYLLWSVIFIVIVLILVIFFVAIRIIRKKRAEEEEKKKQKPIEHEILFDDISPISAEIGMKQEAPTPDSEVGLGIKEGEGEVPERPIKEEFDLEPGLEVTQDQGPDDKGIEIKVEEEVKEETDLIEEQEPEMPEISELEEESEDIDLAVDFPETTVSEPEALKQRYIDTGKAYFKDGRYSDAILEWQKALDIEPNQPEIIKSIKEAMAKMKRN